MPPARFLTCPASRGWDIERAVSWHSISHTPPEMFLCNCTIGARTSPPGAVKYLNGGPGCVAGCFVHERHSQAWDLPRFAGWWGHDEKTRFQMGPDFHPMSGAEGWQLSNPPIFGLAPLRASMEIFSEAGMERLRAKSISLTGYMEYLLRQLKSEKFSVITPCDPARRGAQLSIRLSSHGRDICDKLAEKGVIGDWREPDIFRVAAVPLYNSYADVYRFVQTFAATLEQ